MKRTRRGILCIFLTMLLMAGGLTSYGGQGEGKAAQARDGVVRIMAVWPESFSLGTGFGVGKQGEDADTFVTNWHVVTSSGSNDYHDAKIFILLDDETWLKYKWLPLEAGEAPVEGNDYLQDGQGRLYKQVIVDANMGSMVECQVLYAENQYPDVAILRTAEPVRNVKALPLRKVSQEDVGEDVLAIGYPSSADSGTTTYPEADTAVEKIKASVEAVSVSGGVISRCLPLELFGNTDCIDHGAHINHGNSGGPLVLKKDGSVIGINTYGYGEQASEFNVSIYIDYAMEILDQLELPYTMVEGGKQGNSGKFAAILTGAGILGALAVAAVLLKKKKKKGEPERSAPCEASSELRLQGRKGVFAGRRFQLKPETRIGRDPGRCDFVYPSGTKGISGMHCIITLGQAGAAITDVGSTCGTTVNGKKLIPNQACSLYIGDIICLGSVDEEFQITGKGGAV